MDTLISVAFVIAMSDEDKRWGMGGCHPIVMNIVIFVGNSQDLRLVRQYLELALPNERFEFLMSAVNEVSTVSMSLCTLLSVFCCILLSDGGGNFGVIICRRKGEELQYMKYKLRYSQTSSCYYVTAYTSQL